MSISTEIQRLKNSKEAIKTSLKNKGVEVADDATLDQYAEYVDSIESSAESDLKDYFVTSKISREINYDPNLMCCLKRVENLDLSGLTTLFRFCYYACNLEHLGQLNVPKATRANQFFYPSNSKNSKLTYFGGLKDYGKGFSTSLSAESSTAEFNVSVCLNLTKESLLNILTGVYDIATAGVQPQSLVLGSTNLAKLTDSEIQIALDKGWNVS